MKISLGRWFRGPSSTIIGPYDPKSRQRMGAVGALTLMSLLTVAWTAGSEKVSNRGASDSEAASSEDRDEYEQFLKDIENEASDANREDTLDLMTAAGKRSPSALRSFLVYLKTAGRRCL